MKFNNQFHQQFITKRLGEQTGHEIPNKKKAEDTAEHALPFGHEHIDVVRDHVVQFGSYPGNDGNLLRSWSWSSHLSMSMAREPAQQREKNKGKCQSVSKHGIVS